MVDKIVQYALAWASGGGLTLCLLYLGGSAIMVWLMMLITWLLGELPSKGDWVALGGIGDHHAPTLLALLHS